MRKSQVGRIAQSNADRDTMRPEYDFSDGVRGVTREAQRTRVEHRGYRSGDERFPGCRGGERGPSDDGARASPQTESRDTLSPR
jgi:hypothetical protein